MKGLESIDQFIGTQLVKAGRLVTIEEDREFVSGIELTFSTGSLLIRAVSLDDSLDIERVSGWDTNCFPEQHFCRKDTKIFHRFVGQVLCNAWVCFSGDNYCDSVDFGFGDLNFPNVKVLSLTSELIEFSVSP